MWATLEALGRIDIDALYASPLARETQSAINAFMLQYFQDNAEIPHKDFDANHSAELLLESLYEAAATGKTPFNEATCLKIDLISQLLPDNLAKSACGILLLELYQAVYTFLHCDIQTVQSQIILHGIKRHLNDIVKALHVSDIELLIELFQNFGRFYKQFSNNFSEHWEDVSELPEYQGSILLVFDKALSILADQVSSGRDITGAPLYELLEAGVRLTKKLLRLEPSAPDCVNPGDEQLLMVICLFKVQIFNCENPLSRHKNLALEKIKDEFLNNSVVYDKELLKNAEQKPQSAGLLIKTALQLGNIMTFGLVKPEKEHAETGTQIHGTCQTL